MKQAIICTILSASNTSLWRFLLKGFYRRSRRANKDLKKFLKTGKIWPGDDGKRLFCMVFNAYFLFPGGLWDSAGVLFLHWQYVCLCAWGLWVPAPGCLCWLYGADGACVVELRVNGVEEAGWRGRLSGGCLCSNWEWMQGFCLWRLTQSTVVGSQGLVTVLRVPPFYPEVELHLPFQTREVVLFSAAIKCAMYYVARLKTYTL